MEEKVNFEYYAENHDWDMTFRAARNLIGYAHHQKGKREEEFSLLAGGMLLMFTAVESYINSVAFTISRDDKYSPFSFEEYEKDRGFWDRLKCVCKALSINVDKSCEPYKTLEDFRLWRISLVHSSPFAVEKTEISDVLNSSQLHEGFTKMDYTKQVTLEQAVKFDKASAEFIFNIIDNKGIKPAAMCSYKPVEIKK